MKRVLVTGASGGIGLAITKQLADAGMQVTLVARTEERLKEIIASLPGDGHQCIRADLSLQADIDSLAAHISENHYDVLINNAGKGLFGRFEELDLESHTEMLTLNINALVALSHTYLKGAKSGDTLVNIASVLGFSSLSGASAYAATKGFVLRFSESLWHEFKPKGIHVLAFCPGITASNFYQAEGQHEDQFPKILIQTPEQVAKELFSALKRRTKPVVVPGIMNRLLIFSERFLSRKQMINIMGMFSPAK